MTSAIRIGVVALISLATFGCSEKKSPEPSRIADLPVPTSEALAKIAALPSPYNQGDATKGRIQFADCAECHTLTRGGSQEKGPNLFGVINRRAATGENYNYTEALRNSNIVWDLKHLDQWIFNPRETLPGTTMSYVGVRNDAKRRDVIAYLIAVTE